ncbi:cyclin-T2-like isoform X2 [Oppia nitens]|uniref:cyclin-T2-like isoform X2 n=1 Tax=Oppia nitens TaxID=1686743 RepID=UPI0023D9F74D|nr:cyclin-T2-like isoform X2 [Oppia nitens]
MAGSDRWYFSKEELAHTPSRKNGIDADKELSYRQQAANLIQDMGQRLHVTQLCINTAIVYMHRFYTFHSFTKFHRNAISSCALFLAAKVEEQPRKLEHVIKVSHMCLHRDSPQPLDVKSEAYKDQAMELVINENLMLQTLGFDIAVEHPHTSVVNCCQLVRASKDLAQTSYFMATNSLHLTTMCLQYKPTVVACVCIHLACKWSSWEIPRSSEGKDWFYYVDTTVTLDLLEQLTSEFLAILDKCPSRLKRKILSGNGSNSSAGTSVQNSIDRPLNRLNDEKRKEQPVREEPKSMVPSKPSSHLTPDKPSANNPTISRRSPSSSPLSKKIKSEPTTHQPNQQSTKISTPISVSTYRERKERTTPQPDIHKQPSTSLPNRSSSHQTSRDILNLPKDKMPTKAQTISDKQQKSIDDRNKFRPKNSDYLFDNNRSANPSKSISNVSLTHPKHTQNNLIKEDLFNTNTVHNKPHFGSFGVNNSEDSPDIKREVVNDLHMEFSDNSNQSTNELNLMNSFPTDFMNDSLDSKKDFNFSNNNNNNKLQTNSDPPVKTSFMSIFSTPIATTNSSSTSTTHLSKADNSKTNSLSKHNDVLLRIKSEPLPPMLSPLKPSIDNEAAFKLEKQLSHPCSTQSHSKSFTSNFGSELEPKQHQNSSKISKSSPKLLLNSGSTQQKNSQFGNVVQSIKEKEFTESLPEVKLKSKEIPISFGGSNQTIYATNSNIFNETVPPIAIKEEKHFRTEGTDIPSISSKNKLQTNSNIELDIKPNIDILPDIKPTLDLTQKTQINTNNTSNLIQELMGDIIPPVLNMESIDKTSHSEHEDKEKEKDRHHKHSHHSHKSKHKEKHKHKHKDKDKDREKHKRKDKDRDRDRDRDREKDRDRSRDDREDAAFKISYSSSKGRDEVANNNMTAAPIKLKISKKKCSVDDRDVLSDKDTEELPKNPIKLKIQLNPNKSSNTPEYQSDSSVGRKRKLSPNSSKKEKASKHDLEYKSKEDKRAKKLYESNHTSYDKGSNHSKTSLNSCTPQSITLEPMSTPLTQSRLSKAHK